MSTALEVRQQEVGIIVERVVIQGDLKNLSPQERVSYYRQTCESLGLNPLTRPFEYITLNGKLTLYARKDATEQLRRRDQISLLIVDEKVLDGVYIVKARATTPNGRTDEATGAVAIDNLKGEAKANAIMKAETKAKRRVTLSIVGLGWLDETEIDSIPDARPVVVSDAGEIVEPQSTKPAPVPTQPPSRPPSAEAKPANTIPPFQPATPEQIQTINTLCEVNGFNPATEYHNLFGYDLNLNRLSQSNAATLIDHLNFLANSQTTPQPKGELGEQKELEGWRTKIIYLRTYQSRMLGTPAPNNADLDQYGKKELENIHQQLSAQVHTALDGKILDLHSKTQEMDAQQGPVKDLSKMDLSEKSKYYGAVKSHYETLQAREQKKLEKGSTKTASSKAAPITSRKDLDRAIEQDSIN